MLVLIGMSLELLQPPMRVILVHYGLLSVGAIPFLRPRARSLFKEHP